MFTTRYTQLAALLRCEGFEPVAHRWNQAAVEWDFEESKELTNMVLAWNLDTAKVSPRRFSTMVGVCRNEVRAVMVEAGKWTP